MVNIKTFLGYIFDRLLRRLAGGSCLPQCRGHGHGAAAVQACQMLTPSPMLLRLLDRLGPAGGPAAGA